MATKDDQERRESRGRGFAGMDPERQRQISSQGGKAAHQKGTAHEFDSNEAREAGRKGGQVSGGRRTRERMKAEAETKGAQGAGPEVGNENVSERENEAETEADEDEEDRG
jgi:general stress protein YciG